MSTSKPELQETLLALIALVEPLLNPLVAKVVTEALARLQTSEARLGDGRLWYSEAEAGALLGLPSHRIRDCRRRGEIVGTKVGKCIGFERAELLRFLQSQRVEP